RRRARGRVRHAVPGVESALSEADPALMAPRRGLLLGLAAAALGLALWLGRGARTSAERFALSPPACNTECQRQQTDCVLACEGRLPCERRCIEQGQACVKRCRQPPDA